MISEKPVLSEDYSLQKDNPSFSWINKLGPIFHYILIGIALALASFRFLIIGKSSTHDKTSHGP